MKPIELILKPLKRYNIRNEEVGRGWAGCILVAFARRRNAGSLRI
jgi:hypothetical protein